MKFSKADVLFWLIGRTSRNDEHRRRRLKKLSEKLLKEAESSEDKWQVYRGFPRRALPSTISVSGKSVETQQGKTGVIIQGPVVHRDNMTFETLLLYRQTMPNAELILSTWDDLPSDLKTRFENLGVRVVLSSPPDYAGQQNINLQIKSTSRGIQEAKAADCDYILKTRSDTRIYLNDADVFFRNLLAQFPVADHSGQANRIITLDFATRLFIPYHPSDLLMFGKTDDLVQYWSPELFDRTWTYRHDSNFGRLIDQPLPEPMMCLRYLRAHGIDPEGTIEQWWNVLAERFIVVDRKTIDHFWLKEYKNVYQPLETRWDRTNMALCHFSQWLQMHCGTAFPEVQLDDLRAQETYDLIAPEQKRCHSAA